MQLTKYTHACVRLTEGDRSLVLDPGIWAEDEAFTGASDVLITHEHFDHLDADRLAAAVRADSALTVHAPAAVVAGKLADAGVTAHAVEVGDEFRAAGFAIRAVGGRHADIYDGLPGIANIGYLIEGAVYHPGDALFVPDVPVETLLVPIAAPWLKLAEALDFVRAVKPARAFPIHEAMYNDRGNGVVDNWMNMKGGTDYTRLAPGSTTSV